MSPIFSGPITYRIEEIFDSRTITRDNQGVKMTLTFRAYHVEPVRVMGDLPPHGSPLTVLAESETGNNLQKYLIDGDNDYILFLDKGTVKPESGTNYCTVVLEYREHWRPGENKWHEKWAFNFMAKSGQATSVRDHTYVEHFPKEEDIGPVINFNNDRAEGVQALQKSSTMTCSKEMNFVTPEYLLYLSRLQATLNTEKMWNFFKPRQILFNGSTININEMGRVVLNFTFTIGAIEEKYVDLAHRLNPSKWVRQLIGWRTRLDDKNMIPPSPHDYIWFRFRESSSTDGLVKANPWSAHLNQIYDNGDWSGLQLAGPFAPIRTSYLTEPNRPWIDSPFYSHVLNQFDEDGYVSIPWVRPPNVGTPDWNQI